jgi:hypothetical protein
MYVCMHLWSKETRACLVEMRAVYVCVCACMYVCMYVCMHLWSKETRACLVEMRAVYVCMCACMYVCIHTCPVKRDSFR